MSWGSVIVGKRSDFPRRAQDAYDTPMTAISPLIPHLPRHSTFGVGFYEPCAGAGDLAEGLSALWRQGWCSGASDIAPRNKFVRKADALGIVSLPQGTDIIITNPPWTREILHPMIEHFAAMRPTWLLFDADWMHTKQAAPYLKLCAKIVSVGRVKWIPDSPHTGKDNCAWYLFDAKHVGPTVFWGRA